MLPERGTYDLRVNNTSHKAWFLTQRILRRYSHRWIGLGMAPGRSVGYSLDYRKVLRDTRSLPRDTKVLSVALALPLNSSLATTADIWFS